MTVKTRLERLKRAVNPGGEPVDIHVCITEDDGVRYDGRHLSLAEWEAHKAELKRNGGVLIEVTPESIAKRQA